MDSGGSVGDYAHGYQVFVSNDGVNFGAAVATGTGTTPGHHGRRSRRRSARYVRVVQTQTVTPNWWSIHELNVYGTAGGTPPPAPQPPTRPDGRATRRARRSISRGPRRPRRASPTASSAARRAASRPAPATRSPSGLTAPRVHRQRTSRASTTYYYVVEAAGAGGASPPSNQASATTQGEPDAHGAAAHGLGRLGAARERDRHARQGHRRRRGHALQHGRGAGERPVVPGRHAVGAVVQPRRHGLDGQRQRLRARLPGVRLERRRDLGHRRRDGHGRDGHDGELRGAVGALRARRADEQHAGELVVDPRIQRLRRRRAAAARAEPADGPRRDGRLELGHQPHVDRVDDERRDVHALPLDDERLHAPRPRTRSRRASPRLDLRRQRASPPSTTYYYLAQANGTSGTSASSNQATATTQAPPPPEPADGARGDRRLERRPSTSRGPRRRRAA